MWRGLFNLMAVLSLALWLEALTAWLWLPRWVNYDAHLGGYRCRFQPLYAQLFVDVAEGGRDEYGQVKQDRRGRGLAACIIAVVE